MKKYLHKTTFLRSFLIDDFKELNLLNISKYALLILTFSFFNISLQAEGTKELAPNSDDITALYTNSTSNGSFAQYEGPTDSRLNIHIADPNNEQVFLGFSQQMTISNGVDGDFLAAGFYFRIKDANGNVVYGPTLVDANNANTNTWALAAAGPAPIVGASGYTPFTFDPAGLPAGDYFIEFSLSPTARSFNGTSPSEYVAIKFWDITVATKDIIPTAINGRLWSKRWSLRTPSISHGSDATYTYFDRPFNGQIFTYTNDGFVNEIDFDGSGFRGLSFNLAFNEYGVQNTGDVEADRRSVQDANQAFPQYKIFINNPDVTVYPSGVLGNLIAEPLTIDCNPSDICISYSSSAEGLVEVLLDFDQTSGAGIYDEGTTDVLLYQKLEAEAGESTPYNRCVPWDGLDGLGNTVDLNTVSLNINMTLAQGLVNFPAYDVEFIPIGYTVTQIRPGTASVNKLHYDDINIPDNPNTGIAQSQINGCAPPCHNYANQNYGDLNTINTWWFSSEDVATTSQMSDCILIAYNDSETTPINTAVDIDVTANDTGDLLDPTTVTTTGVDQPSNGTTSINPTTGVITYVPNLGFVGTDVFEYIVCDTGGSPCDTAQVIVTVTCVVVAGQNIISGSVFEDLNESTTYQSGETGDPGITVMVYEDNNQDGLVDVDDTQIATVDTDANGDFSVNVTPVFNGSNSYNNTTSGTLNFQADCSTFLSRAFTVTDNYTISDLNVGLNLSHTYRGDLGVQLISPTGTIVDIITQLSGDGDDNYNLLLDDSSSNPIDNNVTTDPLTPLYENNRTAAPSNPLSAFNGENVNGTWTLQFCNTNFSSSSGRSLTFNSAKLDFSSISSYQGHYVLEIDQGDLPTGGELTTDNIETAVFTATGQSDCTNYFGYVATAVIASNNGPICEGQTLNLFETGGDAISWSWTGPNGFTSTAQNPTIANVTAANSGTYTVTVTDIDNLSATTTTEVLISIPSATANSNSPACTGTNLQLTETGGDAASWSWTGPNSFTSTQKNPSITNVTAAAAGTYTVVITDQYGCTATSSTTVSISNGPSSVAATPNSPSCNGGNDGTIDLAITGGTAPYSYNWSNGTTTGTGNGTTISGLSPATYNITITDVNGCLASTFTVLEDTPLLTVSGSGNSTTYEGASDGSIDIDIQNGNPNYTVSWTGPKSGSDTATSAGAFSINGLSAGDYTITITDVNSCTANVMVTVIDSICELERGPISIIKN